MESMEEDHLQSRRAKNIFIDELSATSERSRFKITHTFVPIRDQRDLLVALINIPGRYFTNNVIFAQLPRVLQLLQNQCGLSLDISPRITTEATFILRHRVNQQVRVFTGSLQRSNQHYNQITRPQTISSIGELEHLLSRASDSKTLHKRLDNSVHFPNSNWDFIGVISLVLNIQTRVKYNNNYRRHTKVFHSI